jgi:hypothetical protein
MVIVWRSWKQVVPDVRLSTSVIWEVSSTFLSP